jgi:hypothetical protein
MFKRLTSPTGEVSGNEKASEDGKSIVRDAILVHSAPNGKVMEFQSADGPIKFDDARIKRIVKNQNAMIEGLAKDYGGLDKMPVGAFPPVLDQHADDSNDRIRGRLNHLMEYKVMDVPGVGKNCSCVVTKILFLGEGTVEKVNDGRIYHLSIGIDENTDTLGETSTVIEPAAAGAMLLNKGKKQTKEPTKMSTKTQKLAKLAKAKKAKRLSALKSLSEGLTGAVKTLAGTKENIRLAKRNTDVGVRLTKLMSSKKLTPAEFKKMDVKKLAALPDEHLDTLISTFEAREDVVLTGQRGTSDAVTFSDMGKSLEKKQMKRLSSETKKDLIRMGAKLKGGMDEVEDEDQGGAHEMGHKKMNEEPMKPGKDDHAVEGSEGFAKMAAHLQKMGEHLAAGDMDGAKETHAEMCKMAEGGEFKHMSDGGLSDVAGEDQQKSMAGLQSQVDELNTQMARFAGMVSEMMSGEEEDEGTDMEAGEDDEESEPKEPKEKQE